MSIGDRSLDLDWRAKTDGTAEFTADIPADSDLIHAALVRSQHSWAWIDEIDASAALGMEGVLAVASSSDLANGTRYIHHGGELADRPPFATGYVAYFGQEIAAVAATSRELAYAAADAVKVRYRPRRAPTSVGDATKPRARAVRPDRDAPGNVSLERAYSFGDPGEGLRLSTVRAHGTFHYPQVTHACMEPNTTRARWNATPGKLELWTSTQAPHFIQREVAAAVGLPTDSVVCREVYVGGGFGSKSKISEHEVPLAVLAMKLPGRMLELRLSREEEFAFTKTRHAFTTALSMGADRHGHIQVMEADFIVDNGAFNHSGPSVASAGAGTIAEVYRPLGARYNTRLVYTAKQPGGQFRGYGTPQVAFAVECLVDEVAETLGIDPIAMRIRNANQPDSIALAGIEVQSARLVECLEVVKRELRWDERRDLLPDGHGLGVAIGLHGSGAYAYEGGNRSSARVEIDTDGRIGVWFGGADAGTGQKTLIAQVVAEELGCDTESVSVTMMDSETTPFDMGAWSSRGTYYSGHAVGLAARSLRDKLLAGEHPDQSGGVLSVEATYTEPRVQPVWSPGTHNKSGTYSFAAHGVEVAIDRATGELRIVDYVAAHDVGRAINPTMVEGQIHGGVAMGLGAALGEKLVHEGGRLANTSYVTYAMPRSPDAPRVRPFLLEGPDAAGPYDAKGIGELTVVPCAPAIANAIYHAVGVRLREVPFTPDRILTALTGDRTLASRVRLRTRPRQWWVEGMRRAYPRGVHRALDTYGTKLKRVTRTPSKVDGIDRPMSTQQARTLVANGGMPLGGGTDLIPEGIPSDRGAVTLVSLARIPELGRISEAADGDLEIGAAVTLAQLARDPRMPRALRQAAEGIAGPAIRNVATLAGNLLQEKRCWFYRSGFDCYKRGGATCPCYAVMGDHSKYHAAIGGHRCQAVTPSDLATVLAVLNASVHVRSACGGERTVPVAKFYNGPGEPAIGQGDIVVRVVIPAAERTRRSYFRKINGWSGDFAMVSIAATAEVIVDRRALAYPRFAFGAIAPTPWLFEPGHVESIDAAQLRALVSAKLIKDAHPLPRNGWKLDAAVGLAEHAMEALVGGVGGEKACQ